jgi:hypothetical protein
MLYLKNVILNVHGNVTIQDVMPFVPQFVNHQNVIHLAKNLKQQFAMLNAKGYFLRF